MRTQLYISPNRKGTVSVTNGSITVTGTNTAFTDADDGSTIIFRTSRGDIERVILNANPNTQTLTLNAAMPLTESGIFYYLEYVEVDLYEDIPFTLTFNIADIRNPDKRNGSYSKTVRLPGTDTNNALLGNIFEIDIDGSYNPNIKALAYIDIDSIEQFRGVLQLLQINRTRDFIEYEVSVYGNAGSLFLGVGNKFLNELDLSAYNHKRTSANIQNSLTTSIIKNGSTFDNFTGSITTKFPNGQPDGIGYMYPILNDGSQQFGLIGNFTSGELTPAIYAKQIIDSIFESVGYTYRSDFLNSSFFKKLIIPYKKQKRKAKIFTNLVITPTPITTSVSVNLIKKSVFDDIETVLASIIVNPNEYYTQLNATTDLYYGDQVYVTI